MAPPKKNPDGSRLRIENFVEDEVEVDETENVSEDEEVPYASVNINIKTLIIVRITIVKTL